MALAGAVAALPPAVEAFLTAFGVWQPTAAQISAVNGLYVALLGVLVVLARAKVTPMQLAHDPAFLDALAAAAYQDVEGVDEVTGEDLHALDVPHTDNPPTWPLGSGGTPNLGYGGGGVGMGGGAGGGI